ncbi:hypothetical protein [Kitasatospora sp. NPDC088264]|uniref:hypothetical protein n=1 Tax=unclassified Kitasatospora TaxID=2633591 RepID=UPI0034209A27
MSAATLSGVFRGLPGPVRGTRIFSSTGGRVAQAVLLALMVFMIDLLTIQDRLRTSSPGLTAANSIEDYDGLTPAPADFNGLPPPHS